MTPVSIALYPWLAELPDPGEVSTFDEVAEQLRRLNAWAGAPSYEVITGRVNEGRPAAERVGRSTVVDCFRSGRRRLDLELVVAVAGALHPDPGYADRWRRTLRVLTGTAESSHQVWVLNALPEESAAFVGREAQLRRVAREAPSVVTLQGMAGAGKTRLAIRLGRQLLDDGAADETMFVDLRGFHESQAPADPAAVLDGLLRALGVPGQRVPARTAERQELWRERVADRRLLLVLDDAADEQQVAPLLPRSPGCVVLVTSRRALAVPGSMRVDVDAFTPAESRRFLEGTVGDVAVGTGDRPLDRIAAHCGHLPLALALVTGQVRARPGWTLSDHADRLDERRAAGQLDPGVAPALELSYRHLSPEAQRLLRALASHPGRSFPTAAAAALAGTGHEVTTGILHDLTTQFLVRTERAGRYVLHDLVRGYAAALAVDEDRRADRRAALNRLLDHSLAAAAADMSRLDPGYAAGHPAVDPAGAAAPELGVPGAWLDAELGNLVATAQLPLAAHDRPAYPAHLSVVLHRYLAMRGLTHLALTVHGRAAGAARETGDPAREADATLQLAMTELRRSGFPEALAHLEVAGELYARCGDETGLLNVLSHRALAKSRVGRSREARRDLLEVLTSRRRLGDGPGTIRTLQNLAGAEYAMGLYPQAAKNLTEALELARLRGDRWIEAVCLCNLGGTELKLGRLAEAEAHLTHALDLARRLAFRGTEGCTWQNLGDLHLARGDHREAGAAYRRALGLLTEVGHRSGLLSVHIGLGDLALAGGDLETAVTEYTTAYDGAREEGIADIEQQALAQAGLGETHRRLGDPAGARQHDERAHALWSRINHTEAARSAQRLAEGCQEPLPPH